MCWIYHGFWRISETNRTVPALRKTPSSISSGMQRHVQSRRMSRSYSAWATSLYVGGLDVKSTELGILVSDMGLEARTASMRTLVKCCDARKTRQIVVADVLREERLAGAQLVGNGPDTPNVVSDLRIMTCAGETLQK